MSAHRLVSNITNGTHNSTRYHEHYGLLWKLKATIESLLSANTSNVWSMYGGLNRLANQLDVILKHGLNQDAAPNEDYWLFVFGLRRIQPVLAPALDQLSRRAELEGRLKGLLWLQDSLENHTLSLQLRMLVAEISHIEEFYSEDAFLRSVQHSAALDTLLQAVEQNNPRLLADVDPNLLQKCPSSCGSTSLHSHSGPRPSRTSSLVSNTTNISMANPRNPTCSSPNPLLAAASGQIPLRTNTSGSGSQRNPDPLLFASPKGESVLDTFEEPAFGQSPPNARRGSAKDALQALLENGSHAHSQGAFQDVFKEVQQLGNDPLLNRPVVPIERESFQRSRQLMHAASDTALSRSSARRLERDENENNRMRKKQRSFESVERVGRNGSCSPMYWEEGGSNGEGNGTHDIQNRLVFTYDNSPSSSAQPRMSHVDMDSSMEEQNGSASFTVGPTFRTKGQEASGLNSRNSSKHSLLGSSNEQLLFSEEEEDQFELLGDLVQRGRQTGPKRRVHSCEDLEAATPSTPPLTRPPYKRHARSKSDQISNMRGGGFEGDDRRDSEPGHSRSRTKNGRNWNEAKDEFFSSSLPVDSLTSRRASDFGSSTPAFDGYFPQPSQGESLFTFLSSQDFATCPELDRENAHFCISEAIIAAVEQIKCRQLMRQEALDHESDGSDEEIQRLKQRIRLRRSEKREQKQLRSANETSNQDVTESGSELGIDSPYYISDSDESMEEAEDFVVTDDASADTNLVAMKTGGLTASLGSLYSDADLRRANKMHPMESVLPISKMEPSSMTSNQLSAESIALSLIKKFSFCQLPAASELDWLVSEKDAPQQLLPLPKSVPISPDDGENADLYKNMRLRGNLEWAPPRPQIVFSIHPAPKRKQLVAKQNYRCAGCGMKVERGFLRRLRYCEYLGKYFCQCCHTNSTSPIPGKILRKWDFSRYPVSNFSQELLSKIRGDPVFNVRDVNVALYRKIRQMQTVKDLRTQLFYLKDFLKTCRLCASLKSSFDEQPGHWMGQPDLYSLSDFLMVKSGEMDKALSLLVEQGVDHVDECPLCQAKGFVCELCNKDDVIFPFQLNTTYQCPDCWACYHTVCFSKDSKCPKCERILARTARKSLIMEKSSSTDEEQQQSSPELVS